MSAFFISLDSYLRTMSSSHFPTAPTIRLAWK
jgi:hypothetical protein